MDLGERYGREKRSKRNRYYVKGWVDRVRRKGRKREMLLERIIV